MTAAMQFKQAVKEKLNGRIALNGSSGGGKTMTALRIGMGMLPPGGQMAVIDTERGSARKYVGEFGIQFQGIELETFGPQNYVAAIKAAADAKFPVLVIDSLSHAWMGAGGLLEQVDEFAKREQSGNSFAAWKKGTPIQTQFIESILSYPGHVIVTMRSKTEYVIEPNSKGKMAPRKIGMAPVQRDGMEYEFDIFADVTPDHDMIVTKTRCPLFVDAIINKADEEFGRQYLGWLNSGVERAPAPVQPAAPAQPVAPTAAPQATIRDRLIASLSECQTKERFQEIRLNLATRMKNNAIETVLTGFDATETYGDVIRAHWPAIKARGEAAAQPDPVPDFLTRVKSCTDPATFAALEKEFYASEVLSSDDTCGNELDLKRMDFEPREG